MTERITKSNLAAMAGRLTRTAISAGVMAPGEQLAYSAGSKINGVSSTVFITGTEGYASGEYREFPGLRTSWSARELWDAMHDWSAAVDATRYNRVAPAAPDSAHPAGYYASNWAAIDPANGHTATHEATGETYKHTIVIEAPDGQRTKHLNITADQAHRILALISEEQTSR